MNQPTNPSILSIMPRYEASYKKARKLRDNAKKQERKSTDESWTQKMFASESEAVLLRSWHSELAEEAFSHPLLFAVAVSPLAVLVIVANDQQQCSEILLDKLHNTTICRMFSISPDPGNRFIVPIPGISQPRKRHRTARTGSSLNQPRR